MKHIATRFRLGSAVLLLCVMAPIAFADVVEMRIVQTPLTLNKFAGVYVSPYSAQITNPSVSLGVVCLDLAETTYLGTPYWYETTGNGGPGNVGQIKPAEQAMYDAAARLAAQLLPVPTPDIAERGRLSFAIWSIFDSNALTGHGLTDADKTAISTLASDAMRSSTQVAYTVYTPWTDDTHTALAAQRMMSVSVPEPSAVALLGLNMSVLLGLIVLFRRRLSRN